VRDGVLPMIVASAGWRAVGYLAEMAQGVDELQAGFYGLPSPQNCNTIANIV
jgi:hypothetical protein